MKDFLRVFRKENDWSYTGRLDSEMVKAAIKAGYIKDTTPYDLGASATYDASYQLLPKGRKFLAENSG